jgi:acylphosphatase
MKGYHLIITGDVTGVGFRKFIKSHAKRLRIKGFVKNTDMHMVEAEIFGEEKNILDLIALCKKGPEVSNVEAVIQKEISLQNLPTAFEIIR